MLKEPYTAAGTQHTNHPPRHTLQLGPLNSHTYVEGTERYITWRSLPGLSAKQSVVNIKPEKHPVALDYIFVNQRGEILNPIEVNYLLRNRKHHPDTLVRVYEVEAHDIDAIKFTDKVITPILLHTKGYQVAASHEWVIKCTGSNALLAYAPLLFTAFTDEVHLREEKVLLNTMLGNTRLRTITIADLHYLLECKSVASLNKYKRALGLTSERADPQHNGVGQGHKANTAPKLQRPLAPDTRPATPTPVHSDGAPARLAPLKETTDTDNTAAPRAELTDQSELF